MNHVGGEPGQLADQGAADDQWQADLGVARQAHRWQSNHLEALTDGGRVAWRDDQSLVAGPAQVPEHLQHRASHTVDVGRNDSDTTATLMQAVHQRPGLPLMSVRCRVDDQCAKACHQR